MTISTLNPFTLRVRIGQFFKEKGRMPSEEEIKEMDAKITVERIASNVVYGITIPKIKSKDQKELKILSEVLSNNIQKDKNVESEYPKLIVCDLLDHIDGNPPVKNLQNDKIMKPYREFSKELEENFDYDESTGSIKRKEKN